MLTARGEEQDELFGFELGVDEYISKPFSPKILVARVEAILKRLQVKEKEVKDYGGIVINPEGRTVEVDSKKIDNHIHHRFGLNSLLYCRECLRIHNCKEKYGTDYLTQFKNHV